MMPFRPELPALTSRSIVSITSAEVNGDPSPHLTFCRSLKVHSDPSAFGVHDSASAGFSLRSPPAAQRYS